MHHASRCSTRLHCGVLCIRSIFRVREKPTLIDFADDLAGSSNWKIPGRRGTEWNHSCHKIFVPNDQVELGGQKNFFILNNRKYYYQYLSLRSQSRLIWSLDTGECCLCQAKLQGIHGLCLKEAWHWLQGGDWEVKSTLLYEASVWARAPINSLNRRKLGLGF